MTTPPEHPKVVAILGAGPGMGAALARAFSAPDHQLVLLARDEARLNSLCRALALEGVDAAALACDLSSTSDVRRALAEVDAAWGPPEILIYNASLYVPGTPTTTNTDAVLDGFRVSIIGALAALQCVVPAMRVRGRGTVLFTGGGTALNPWVEAAGLSMQKAALRNLAESAARELAPDNIHVGLITIAGVIGSPGFEPERLAAHYVALHRQKPSEWTHEIIVNGGTAPATV